MEKTKFFVCVNPEIEDEIVEGTTYFITDEWILDIYDGQEKIASFKDWYYIKKVSEEESE